MFAFDVTAYFISNMRLIALVATFVVVSVTTVSGTNDNDDDSGKKNKCERNPALCQNGGTCNPVGLNDFTCVCPPSRTGKHCGKKIKLHPCQRINGPCKNGATCEEKGDDFTCHCAPGWKGKHCIRKHGEPGECTCTAKGDPHYQQFDGNTIHYQGYKCIYTLVRVDESDCEYDYEVQVKNQQSERNPRVATTKEVFVIFRNKDDGEIMQTLRLGQNQLIQINDDPPINHDGKIENEFYELTKSTCGYSKTLKTDCMTLKWDGKNRLNLEVIPSDGAKAYGICGKCNGNSTDDWLIRNGTDVIDVTPAYWRYKEFGDGWIASGDVEECKSEQPPDECSDENEAMLLSEDWCGYFSLPDGPFKDCLDLVDEEFTENCVYDLCAMDTEEERKKYMCMAAEDLLKSCYEMHGRTITPIEFRDAMDCPADCEDNMVYRPRIDTTNPTCEDPVRHPVPDSQVEEGCECMENMYFETQADKSVRCVPQDKCGCMLTDEEYKLPVGGEYIDSTCTKKYTCMNGLTPEEYDLEGCNETAHLVCKAKDGVYGCHCEDGFTMIDGECKPDQNSCKPNPCKHGGECKEKKSGGYKCKCKGEWRGKHCEKKNVCKLPMEPGPCTGSFERWYYDKQEKICKTFTYGGCQGNDNRFKNKKKCEKKCVKKGTNDDDDDSDKKNKCERNPTLCQNGGTCNPVGLNDFTCVCPPSRTGKHCGKKIKPHPCHRVNGPCKNGGTCEEKGDDFTCHCAPGWKGKHCKRKYGEPGECTCAAKGDPHYQQFDGNTIHYQGYKCIYTLVRVDGSDCEYDYEVQVKNQQSERNPRVATTKEVFVIFRNKDDGEIMHTLRLGQNHLIQVNADPPINHDGKIENEFYELTKSTCGYAKTLKTDCMTLKWDGKNRLNLEVIPSDGAKAYGICGKCNGNSTDDWLIRNGTDVIDMTPTFRRYKEFGDGWIASGDEEECKSEEPPNECSDEDEAVLPSDDWCGYFSLPNGPFKDCLDIVDEEFTEDCVYDLCAMDTEEEKKRYMCMAAEDLLKSCYERHGRNNPPIEFRDAMDCPADCGDNMVYRPRIDTTNPTCEDPVRHPVPDSQVEEGCECMENTYFETQADKSARCVPQDKCGCILTDEEYKLPVGGEYIDSTCTKKYTCMNGLTPEAYDLEGCNETAHLVCKAKDGVYGCYCEEGFTMIDGECKPDKNPCKPNPCKHGGKCKEKKNGGYKCKCKGEWRGKHCQKIKKNVCKLPMKPGPCRGSFKRWYYDKQEKKCKTFIYGGCKGNGNRFNSKRKCEKRCVKRNVCKLPVEPGPCTGSFERWYYDKQENICKTFTYGGCQGNDNRFKNKKKCERKCVKKGSGGGGGGGKGNLCRLNPCRHGGTCIEKSRDVYECCCPKGWTGQDCEIQEAPPKPSGPYAECISDDDPRGIMYFGTMDTTTSGRKCQPWASQHPHGHSYTGLLGTEGNYCRNRAHGTTGLAWPWCFTTDPDKRWEYCGRIPFCSNLNETFQGIPAIPGCYDREEKGISYAGPVNYAGNGLFCREHGDFVPYCRNPQGGAIRDRPSCWTDNLRLEDCEIPICALPPPPPGANVCNIDIFNSVCESVIKAVGNCYLRHQLYDQCDFTAVYDSQGKQWDIYMPKVMTELKPMPNGEPQKYTNLACEMTFEVFNNKRIQIRFPLCGYCAKKTYESFMNDIKDGTKSCPAPSVNENTP